METNDLIRRAEDLAARCERTSSVTATAFLTPAERMELQNTPSLRGTAVAYSGGGTECERTCAFFLPFYLTAEELDPSEYIGAVHFRSFFGEPGHRDYLGALLVCHGAKKAIAGLMDVMESDIRQTPGNSNFRLDGLIDGMQACIRVVSGYTGSYEITRRYEYE